ncbi:MAG: glycerol-3-phosphate dehydrogenase/oxidase, partial [Chloroflexota bacterium]|nr:glycerol-3-phosphate dehydrogenase/oxidase [Chloroflexota bacterium]
MTIRPEIGSLADQRFDLIVIGAGINGAGIARDAAMRGLRVLLLDKGDIGGGTTSWSTRLIHGGLRYLEHAEIGLVRESLRERERLLRIASHLVKPLPLMIPIYRGDRRGPWLIRLGMVAYDLLSYDKSLDRHRMLSREEALHRLPALNPTGLAGAAIYYDAQVEYAERIPVENAISAHENGAVVLTYAKVDRIVVEDGRATGVEFEDLLGGERYSAHAPVTLNMAGPWVDEVLSDMDRAEERMIGGTKGSHLVVDPFPGAPQTALYVEAQEDGRPYFIVPWNGRYLIGTTDIRYEDDLDYVEASEEEINYLIEETNRIIPEANLSRDDVLFTYSGVRPLPYQPEGAEGGVTRRHLLYDHAEKDPK